MPADELRMLRGLGCRKVDVADLAQFLGCFLACTDASRYRAAGCASRLYFWSACLRPSCGKAVTVWPETPVMSRAPTIALTMASSVACTVASKMGPIASLGSMLIEASSPEGAAAFGLAVEKAIKMSPDPLPETEPRRARPSEARRARRLV